MGNPISPAPKDPACSPSPSIDKVAKNSWIGGTPKGDTNPATTMGDQHNKKPITVPISK